MKLCGCCGHESEEEVTHCAGCGTAFVAAVPPGSNSPLRHGLDSPLGGALSSVLGSVLIPTGIGFAAMRLFFDVQELANGGPMDKPGVFAVGMMGALFILPPLALGTVIFAFTVCLSRCQRRAQGLASALVAISVVLVLVACREFWVLFPAVLLGKATHSSVGWYLGSAIQLGIGAWLLGWFDRWKKQQRRTAGE